LVVGVDKVNKAKLYASIWCMCISNKEEIW